MNQYPNDPTTGYNQPYNGQTPPPNYPPQGYPQPGYTPPPPGYGQPQYPQQPPMQQPPKKKSKKGLWITLGCIIGAVVICGAIANAGKSGSTSTTPTTPSNPPSNSSSSSNPAPPPPSKPQVWTTTHTYTGSGQKKTETITVPADWKIQWQCDPTSFDGMSYNVIIGVDNSDGTMADPAAINDMCKIGNTSGETEERTAGNVYLDVNSEGSWTITIQELK